jgi:superfamily II DNA or RNA helicase
MFVEPARLFSMHRIVTGSTRKINKALKLRVPQENALWGMKQALVDDEAANGKETGRFMVILPTGCGKTRVMALAPFMLEGKSVLIIAPGVPLRNQTVETLTQYFHKSEFSPIFKGGGVPSVAKLEINGGPQHADIYVANIQSLVQAGAPPIVVRETVQSLFAQVKFDVCLVDEGHHGPAESWYAVEKELLASNPRCRIVLLTATPRRGDARTYGLKDERCFYLYPRAVATRERYIKATTFHPVDVTGEL